MGDDELIAMFRGEHRLASRKLARGLTELLFAPVACVGAVGLAIVYHSLLALLVLVVLGLVSFVAGVVHVVGGVADLRAASRELGELAAKRALPEARVIVR